MIRSSVAIAGVTLLLACAGHGQVAIQDNDNALTVSTPHYTVTFDRTRGGMISRLGDRAVEQKDHADNYHLSADVTSDQSVVIVQGFHVDDQGRKAPSRLRAEYRYVFHEQSPIVLCQAIIRQNHVNAHADFPLLPSWPKLTILDFGEQVGSKQRFGGEQMRKRIFFAPGAPGSPGNDKLFDVSQDQIKPFLELTQPKPPITKPLLLDEFDDKSNWTDVRGKWRIEDGLLIESSAEGAHAWIVAGSDEWDDYLAQSQVLSEDGHGLQYLCARWQDPDNHYALVYIEWPLSGLRIDRVVNGKRVILAETGAMPTGTLRNRHRLTFAVRGAQLRAYRGDELLLEVLDTTFARGRVALGTATSLPVAFDDCKVHQLKPLNVTVPIVKLVEPVTRHAFYRDEDHARITYVASANLDITGVTATLVMRNDRHPAFGDIHQTPVEVGILKAGESHKIEFKLDPSKFRSGDYTVHIALQQGERILARDKITLYLRRRPNPDRMIVTAWDHGDPKRLAAYGFNRDKALGRNTKTEWRGAKPWKPQDPQRLFKPDQASVRQDYCDLFDEYLKHGMWGYMDVGFTTRIVEGVEAAYALKRNGKELQDRGYGHYGRGQPRPNPWHPKHIELIEDFWRQELQAFKDLPAWNAVLLNSESERQLHVYGNDYWLAMAKKELGFDVPADVEDPWGVKPDDPPLPKDGIIESDNPYYRFYRWWHQRGEGQRMLDAKVAEVIHTVRPDVKVWHDPALRQAFVRGRLRGMDEILHWFYSWPIPRRAPLVADELRLAAVDGQSPIFQVQLIAWGHIAIHPNGPHWPHVKTDRYLPAHSPAVVRQVSWLAISRGVSGIGYHGVQTVDRLGMARKDERAEARGDGYEHYMYSNPDTLEAIKQLSNRLIKPYGMVTKRLSPPRAPIAMLLSTASAVLAHQDSMNFRANEAGRMYAKLQAAHLPVEPVYEIDLEERGLADFKAVALPGCRVLPRHLYDVIRKFEAAGGIVIADEHLVPRFSDPIILKWNVKGWDIGKNIQPEILGEAPKIRETFVGRIERQVDCDSPSVALSTLNDGPNRLLFAINTLMKAGDYVGGWGSVLDDGVPQAATLKIRKADCVIYDALTRRRVEPQSDGDWLTWPVDLGPGEGRLFAILPRPIGPIAINVPDKVVKGTSVTAAVTIPGAAGHTPLRITIRDSQNMRHDYSDYAVAVDGRANVTFPVALNEPAGHWAITTRDLYAGREATARFVVERR